MIPYRITYSCPHLKTIESPMTERLCKYVPCKRDKIYETDKTELGKLIVESRKTRRAHCLKNGVLKLYRGNNLLDSCNLRRFSNKFYANDYGDRIFNITNDKFMLIIGFDRDHDDRFSKTERHLSGNVSVCLVYSIHNEKLIFEYEFINQYIDDECCKSSKDGKLYIQYSYYQHKDDNGSVIRGKYPDNLPIINVYDMMDQGKHIYNFCFTDFVYANEPFSADYDVLFTNNKDVVMFYVRHNKKYALYKFYITPLKETIELSINKKNTLDISKKLDIDGNWSITNFGDDKICIINRNLDLIIYDMDSLNILYKKCQIHPEYARIEYFYDRTNFFLDEELIAKPINYIHCTPINGGRNCTSILYQKGNKFKLIKVKDKKYEEINDGFIEKILYPDADEINRYVTMMIELVSNITSLDVESTKIVLRFHFAKRMNKSFVYY